MAIQYPELTRKYLEALAREEEDFRPTEWAKRELVKTRPQRPSGSVSFEQTASQPRSLSQHHAGTGLQRIRPIPSAARSSSVTLSDQPTRRGMRKEILRICDAWEEYRESRRRDAIYPYLSRVFGLVQRYSRSKKAKRLLRRACKFAGIQFDGSVDPFATIIRCTSGKEALPKDISKWSRALRYAARGRRRRTSVKDFIKEAGGINACANRYARDRRRQSCVRASGK